MKYRAVPAAGACFDQRKEMLRGLAAAGDNFRGSVARVEILGLNRPNEVEGFDGIYIPLPEYGVSLWFDKEKT